MGDRKENGSKVSLQFLSKCSPPRYFYNKSNFILTVPLSILFFPCSQSTYYNRLDRHLTCSLLSTVHHAVIQILLSIVTFKFHHVATQNPGHGTKFVTLPSPVLLYKSY